MKEIIKSMKETLVAQTSAQLANLQCISYEELGAAIDMIKDLEEALYYCAITEAMEKSAEKEEMPTNTYYYTERYMPPHDYYYRDIDRKDGRMYYDGNSNMESSSTRNYSSSDREYPIDIRDSREGKSPMSRRMYMESKEMHMDKAKQLRDLEKYMQELTTDIAEMIEDSSPEEKQLLQKKLSALSTKIEQMK